MSHLPYAVPARQAATTQAPEGASERGGAELGDLAHESSRPGARPGPQKTPRTRARDAPRYGTDLTCAFDGTRGGSDLPADAWEDRAARGAPQGDPNARPMFREQVLSDTLEAFEATAREAAQRIFSDSPERGSGRQWQQVRAGFAGGSKKMDQSEQLFAKIVRKPEHDDQGDDLIWFRMYRESVVSCSKALTRELAALGFVAKEFSADVLQVPLARCYDVHKGNDSARVVVFSKLAFAGSSIRHGRAAIDDGTKCPSTCKLRRGI
ncbi:hypothetical protein FNF28_04364 [Cafeteria roenbergensis]|uniref:Uncharacterized protein n=1 Tax=Cafeteria roenbergensis TaxID=33653 RepID=A0A5A8DF14_CAFRO|nr:hypothetical protein FNF28_04364 [Cafeteria roenbergensis]